MGSVEGSREWRLVVTDLLLLLPRPTLSLTPPLPATAEQYKIQKLRNIRYKKETKNTKFKFSSSSDQHSHSLHRYNTCYYRTIQKGTVFWKIQTSRETYIWPQSKNAVSSCYLLPICSPLQFSFL